VHRLQDPYPIWAKALVAAYLAEEGFLRGSWLFDAATDESHAPVIQGKRLVTADL